MEKCTRHNIKLEFLAGHSAHPDNLYCPACDKEKEESRKKMRDKARSGTLCSNCVADRVCPPANLSGAHQVFACAHYIPNTERKKGVEETRNKNDWHKRGEYPPVGTEYEFSADGIRWEERVMLFNDGITFLHASRKHPSCRWHYKCDAPELQFRPLQTEREQLIDEAISVASNTYCIKETVERLADAGMLKMPENKS